MTKNELVQYCDLQNEIIKLEKRIDKIEKQSQMVADVVQKGYKGKAYIYGYDCKRANKIDLLKLTLRQRYDTALELQNNIETWINAIERSDVRQIFEHRYIDGFNWSQIQILMKYKHEDTARKKHDKFLEENL